MMNKPIKALIYCLLGIVAAGLPLAFFAAPTKLRQEPATVATEATTNVIPVLIRYTDEPVEVKLLYLGKEILSLKPDRSGKWYGALALPSVRRGSVLELEVRAMWPDPLLSNQAITVQLLPPGLPASSDTQWTDTGVGELHATFLFRW